MKKWTGWDSRLSGSNSRFQIRNPFDTKRTENHGSANPMFKAVYVSVSYMQSISEEQEPKRKITLTVPLIHTKTHSRKYDRYVTRGYYFNIPQEIAVQMDLKPHELVEVTLKKLK